MTDNFDILSSVKADLGITGNSMDNLLNGKINEAKEYLTDAGISDKKINDERCAGLIARCVDDLWFGGNGKISEYAKERIIQLRASDV